MTNATAFDPEEDVLPKLMLSHEHWELTEHAAAAVVV